MNSKPRKNKGSTSPSKNSPRGGAMPKSSRSSTPSVPPGGKGNSSSMTSLKGGAPQRKISQSSTQAPSIMNKSSQSVSSATSRKMSQASGVGSKRGDRDDQEGTVASLKQSFRSLMITKRMARSLRQRTSQRLADRRGVSFISYTDRPRRRSPTAQHQPRVENSYQLEPRERFSIYTNSIHDIIRSLVDSRLESMKYDAIRCSKEAEELSDLIKDRVKTLGIRRYKLITLVHIGKLFGQGMQIGSRNSWDPQRDSFVSYRFQNSSLFCVVTVYGVYYE
ncbi:uncharacterized protein [Diadema setosum]|uniref:uncharacterized protein n=1 Tax=Diadema setosum TaxID=31175 RepID=UPI003B3B38B8